ncbi:MAG TPA: mannose-1-phosphate guanyltransferase [bacterium]|nr:mannose-1-phosphate guanyltransferase [bacterium]
MKAVIMAGGFGTRMRPLTINIPKPMLPMVNRPMMEIIVDLLKKHKLNDMISVVFYQPEIITEYFRDGADFGIQMAYKAAESDLGTAGSVKNCQSMIGKERFVVISGDVLTDFDLTAALKFHEQNKAKATMVLTRVENPLAFGVVITAKDGKIERFLEKPTWGEVFSDTVNTGIYILEPEVLDLFPEKTEYDFSKNLFPLMLKEGMPLYGYIAQGYWADIGNLDQYRIAHQDIFAGKVEVGIPGSRQNKMGKEIWTGKGCHIDPSAQLSGTVVLGDNCNIGKNARISNSVLGDGCQVEEGVVLTNATVWRNVQIGAEAQARECVISSGTDVHEKASIFEGAIISDNCSIGKEAVIKAGVKVWPNKVVEDGAQLSTSLIWGDKWSRSIFGQHGVTGMAGIDITPEFASKLGAAYGASLPKGSTVVTARDIHKTSRMINRALISGILSSGVNVHDLQDMPISVARYAVPKLSNAGGLHTRKSPFDKQYIDIKFFDNRGLALSSGKEKGIENLFYREDFRRATMEETGELSFPHRLLEFYHEGFLEALDVKAIAEAKPKVVIDYAFSAAAPIFPWLLGKLGCEVVALNAYMDETKLTKTQDEFNAALKQLSDIVPTLKANFGVLFDAGAEKIFVVDEKGHLLHGTELLALFSLYTYNRTPGAKTVVPVNGSQILDDLAKAKGGKLQRTRINYYSLMEAAAQKDVAFAGESDGGLIFPKFAPIMDAMMSTAKLMEVIALEKKPISHYLEQLPKKIQVSQKVPCSWEMKGTIMRHLIEDTANEKRELIDGVKLTLNGSSVMILPDADMAIFHVSAESETEKKAQELVASFSEKIKKWQG